MPAKFFALSVPNLVNPIKMPSTVIFARNGFFKTVLNCQLKSLLNWVNLICHIFALSAKKQSFDITT